MPDFNYDYTKVMLMKMFLAKPSENGSEVLINFEQALNIIKRIDAITQNIQKIIYLVGWQYRGHDDRYPDIYEVNGELKSADDESSYQALVKLIKEARKYNTVVSLHVNFADAYEDAEVFPLLLANNALIRDKDGKATAVETYNGKPCYKVSYKEYWESGMFKRHFDRFIDFLPIIKEQKTIHVDNFQCYFNFSPDIHVSEMQQYRNKMIEYVRSFGLDITSEGVYRECEAGKDNYNCGVAKDIMLKQPVATLDKIPALWWLSPYGDDDFINIPLNRLCGGLPGDEYYEVFYGNTHGEDVWLEKGCENGKWEQTFIDKFARETIPYLYLNGKRCVKIDTDADGAKTAFFADGTISCGKTATITDKNGAVLKNGSTVSMPAVFMKNTYLFYSREAARLSVKTEGGLSCFRLYRICAEGNEYLGETEPQDGFLSTDVKAYECVIAIHQPSRLSEKN